MRPRQRLLTACVAVVALVVAACGATPASSPQASATPSVAPATATPGPTATPSASPLTIADVLAKLADSKHSFTAAVTGKVDVGSLSAPVTGTLEVASGATRSELTITLPAGSQTTEQIAVGGKSYKRSGSNAPWFEVPPSTAGKDLGRTLATIGNIDDKGTSIRNGQTVHHFATIPGAIPASALGFDHTGIDGFSGSMDLYTNDSGTLLAIGVSAGWTQQDPAGASLRGSMTLDFALSDSTPVITAPEDLWVQFTSARWHYAIGYPAGVTTIEGKKAADLDVFAASSDEFYAVIRETQPKGVTLAGYVKAYITATTKQMKVKPESQGDITIDGRPGKVLIYHLKLQGKDRYNVVLMTLDGRSGYTISLVGLPGQETNMNSFADQLVSTFSIAE